MNYFKLLLILLLLLHTKLLTAQINTAIDTTIQYKSINFTPTVFYREFSSETAPVLTINPGETVSTESVDAVGYDQNGTKRSERGNPLTGPFYITGAAEGDVIAVTLLKVSLNRNYATTLEAFVPRSLPKNIIGKTWRKAKLIKWNLDLENNIATPTATHDHLQNLKVPLKPFLGCVGVATFSNKGISTSDSGPFGGNLDFNAITQSATVYLPVFHNGALLFLGDGHAVQGDGELNGDALETSTDVEFTVQVIKNEASQLVYPRVEDPNYIMAFGIARNLDDAMQNATLNLYNWLQKDYQLSFEEVSQVIGPAVEYSIPKVAATKVEIVAKLKKEILKGLKKYN